MKLLYHGIEIGGLYAIQIGRQPAGHLRALEQSLPLGD